MNILWTLKYNLDNVLYINLETCLNDIVPQGKPVGFIGLIALFLYIIMI